MLRRLAANPNTSCPFMLSHVVPWWLMNSYKMFHGFDSERMVSRNFWWVWKPALDVASLLPSSLSTLPRRSQVAETITGLAFRFVVATLSWWYCYGQNPAPPRIMIIPLFKSHRVFTCFNHPRWCRISSIKSSCCGSWGMSYSVVLQTSEPLIFYPCVWEWPASSCKCWSKKIWFKDVEKLFQNEVNPFKAGLFWIP